MSQTNERQSAPGLESPIGNSESEIQQSEDSKPVGRFKTLYNKYRAKGKWFLVGFFVFYLVRDTILYIILPWYLAKGGVSLWDKIFGS